MNLVELFNLAIRALRANLMRTALTMLGIVIGISSVIIIISLGQGASAAITDQVSSFGTNWVEVSPVAVDTSRMQGPPVSTLTLADADAIKNSNNPNISDVSGYLTQTLIVSSADGQSDRYTVGGISSSMFRIFSIDIDKGSFFTNEDEKALAKVAVIGPQVAKDLFGEGTSPIGKQIKIGNKTFRVIGVTQDKGSSGFVNYDENIYIPLRTGMKLVFGDVKLQVIIATVKNTDLIEMTMNDIGNLLLSRHKIDKPQNADFSIHNSKDALGMLNTVTGLLTSMLVGIAGISLVVGGIGIMNIMLVSVTERTREIGLLKAIGAKPRDILRQFVVEAVLLTLVGGVVGIIVGASLSYLASHLVKIPFVLSPLAVLLAVGVATIIGMIFGFYPARRAARLNPIDALRYE